MFINEFFNILWLKRLQDTKLSITEKLQITEFLKFKQVYKL